MASREPPPLGGGAAQRHSQNLFAAMARIEDKPADNIRSVQPRHMVEVHLYSLTVANLLCQAVSSYNGNAIINAVDNKSDTLDVIYAIY